MRLIEGMQYNFGGKEYFLFNKKGNNCTFMGYFPHSGKAILTNCIGVLKINKWDLSKVKGGLEIKGKVKSSLITDDHQSFERLRRLFSESYRDKMENRL